MSDATATEMDAVEIAEFLESQNTGVLSLADGDAAYGLPVSFVYRPDDQRVFFRFGYAPGSQKRAFLGTTEHASFAVYDRTDEGWTSVVASGRLVELSSNDADTSVVEAVEQLRIPYYQVFDRSPENLEFGIVRLDVDSIHGIVEGGG